MQVARQFHQGFAAAYRHDLGVPGITAVMRQRHDGDIGGCMADMGRQPQQVRDGFSVSVGEAEHGLGKPACCQHLGMAEGRVAQLSPLQRARERQHAPIVGEQGELVGKVGGAVEHGGGVAVAEGALYPWRADSTYIQEPPFLAELTVEPEPVRDIRGARVLALLGDSITTDHISPAGDIPVDSPAGRYLIEHGVKKPDFNSYGSRRGNDRVMVRGTFANIRLKNLLAPGTEGGVTTHFPGGERMAIFDAATRYREEGVPLVVIAGKEYGSGSSRDWAAKGTMQLGVKAVVAESDERIHRSNLVGMGVLPLQFRQGENAASLGLTGQEVFEITGLGDRMRPLCEVEVAATAPDGAKRNFKAVARLDSEVEVGYYRNGGILPTVLRNFLKQN